MMQNDNDAEDTYSHSHTGTHNLFIPLCVTDGSYYVDDIEVSRLNKLDIHRFRKKNIGFVFQHFCIVYYSCTVFIFLGINIPHYTLF